MLHYMHSYMLYMCEWCIAFHSFPTCIQDGIWPGSLIYPSPDFAHAYNTQIYCVYVLCAVICKVYHCYTSAYHTGMPCVRLWLHLFSVLHHCFMHTCIITSKLGCDARWLAYTPIFIHVSYICVDCLFIHAIHTLSVFLSTSCARSVFLSTPHAHSIFLSTPYAQGVFLSTPCTQGVFLSSHVH